MVTVGPVLKPEGEWVGVGPESRATRTLLISENRAGPYPATDVRIADHPAGTAQTSHNAVWGPNGRPGSSSASVASKRPVAHPCPELILQGVWSGATATVLVCAPLE